MYEYLMRALSANSDETRTNSKDADFGDNNEGDAGDEGASDGAVDYDATDLDMGGNDDLNAEADMAEVADQTEE